MVLGIAPIGPFAQTEAWAETEDLSLITESAHTGDYISGNWHYSLMAYDIACINGYEGDPTSLKIPTELDGHPVGEIGQGAFASLKQLKSVTIPTQVFSIGAGAFYHPESLTITSYDGSEALRWAKENGATAKSLTDMYLNDGVVDLSGVGSAAVVTEEGYMRVNAALSCALPKGTIFFFTATDKYGMNFWGGRVTGVSRSSDGATIQYVTLDPGFYIDKIVANSDMEGMKIEFTPSPDLEYMTEDGVEATKVDISLFGDIYARVYDSKNKTLFDQTVNVLNIPVTIKSVLQVNYDFLYDPNVFSKDVVKASLDMTLTTTIKAHKETHGNKRIKLGDITIYGVKGFQIHAPIYVVASFDGSIDIDIKDVVEVSWNYDSSKNKSIPKPVISHYTPKREIILKCDIKVGLDVELAIEACWTDVISLGVEGGVKVSAQLALPRNCVDLTVKLYADFYVDTCLTDKKTWPIAEKVLYTGHYEITNLYPLQWEQVSKCTRGDKTVKFVLNGGEPMNAFSDKKVAWGTSFFITSPTRAKYNFKGWFTDSALTQKWTNGSIIKTDTTLYAAWERKYEPVTRLTINKSSMTLHSSGGDRTGKITATISPSDATNKQVKWSSSDKSVATVDGNGNVTGISKGTATITATSADKPNIKASCTVTVQQYVTSINVTAANTKPLRLGTTQVSATVNPSNANNKNYTWSSSNNNVATVSSSGVVTAKVVGSATITATATDGSGVKGSVTINVQPIPVSEVSVNTNAITIYTSGDERTAQLSATVLPANADNRSVTWTSSNEAVAGVDANGKVTGMSAGTTVITVRSNDNPSKYAQTTVTVKQYVTRLGLSQTSATLAPGETAQWTASVTPADATDKSVRWTSSNPRVATVSSSGLITAVAGGDAVISVQAKDGSGVMAQGIVHVTGTAAEPVTPDPSVNIESITLSTNKLRVFTNGAYQTMQLTAFISPENAANPDVIWSSSNSSVARVDQTGKVTGVVGGTAVITATSAANSNIKATCQVIVEQLADSISLNMTSKTILKGDTVQLTGTVLPTNATNRTIKWISSDTGIAIVDYRGMVKGVGLGTTTIIAEAQDGSGVTAAFTLTVNPVPVASVTLNQSAITAYTEGRQHTVQLQATVLPANAEDPSLTWTSSNTAVATVSSSGLVTGVSQGTAVITATSNFDNSIKATATVTVKTWVTGITLTIERKVMEPGESLQATATAAPSDATDKSVTWTSDNPNVVSVNASGLLTSHTIGNAVITATAKDGSGVSASMNINVTENPVYEIRTGVTSVNLKTTGDQRAYQMTWEVLPAKATDKSVTWTSSDNEIAYVDGNGRIIGVSGGTVTATVQSDSNPEVTATVEVNVEEMVESVVIYTDTDVLTEGETLQLEAEVGPVTANNRAVNWTTSNAAVATVTNSGLVTAVGTGTATITATAADGSGQAASVTLKVEKWLTLSGQISDGTYMLNGDTGIELGEIMLTDATVRRIKAAGLKPTWTLTSNGTHTRLALEERMLTYQTDDSTFDCTCAAVQLKELVSGGTDTWTLTCTAGSYTASQTFQITCDATAYAGEARISWNDVTVNINEEVTIPATPQANGAGTLPAGLTLSLEGDDLDKGTVTFNNGAASIRFAASSIYNIDAVYRTGNMSYTVPLTIRVKGADGLVKLPVRKVELSATDITMVKGESLELAAVGGYGSEIVECAFTWESSDPDVVSVNQNGTITAVETGRAVIYATAEDSDVYGWCMVTVENMISFVQDEIDETVYVGGKDKAELANVLLTTACTERLGKQNLKPTWKLTKVSGDSVELAVDELDGSDETTVSGSLISLVRIYGAGETSYRLACTAGTQTVEIPVIIRAVTPEAALPESVSMTTGSYTVTIHESVRIEFANACSPATSALPEGTEAKLVMTGAFGKAIERADIYDDYAEIAFSKSGTFRGHVLFEGVNYSYDAPFTVSVKGDDGTVAIVPEEITITPDYRFMMVGDTTTLNAVVTPENAANQTVVWSSYDTAVATVSEDGLVTAIGPGNTVIRAASEDADVAGEVTVYVEDGLSMEYPADTINVYLDGLTRTTLDSYYLTFASSMRAGGMIPKWNLTRVSGSNLTLRAVPTEEITANGIIRLGAEVSLYSVTRTGTAVYDLTCTVGNQSATTRLTINAQERSDMLPDHLNISQSEYQAQVDELIVFEPEITAIPATLAIPGDLRVSFELDDNATAAVNHEDYFVSRARSTFSFHEAGTYYANCIYRSGNVRYTIPVTFRIADQNGQVPVFVNKVTANPKALYLEQGSSAQISAVFSPLNATNQNVTFTSNNPDVATVSETGVVQAVSNGYAQITITPSDPHTSPAVCNVTVDQGFSITSSTDSLSLYLQGEQQRVLSQYQLKEGTLQRLEAEGLTPNWTVTRKSGNAATYAVAVSDDRQRLNLTTEALRQGGTDVYTVSCTAGSYSWTSDFTLNVIDLGSSAPESVALLDDQVNMRIGEAYTIQTAPVIQPSGAELPAALLENSEFTGIGDFYDALNYNLSGDVFGEAGDELTLVFNKPGTYLLFRSWSHLNLHYEAPCVIHVAGAGQASEHPLFTLSDTECTVYAGGQSMVAVKANLNDAFLYTDLKGQITWSLERVSGSAVTASLTQDQKSAGLFIANVKQSGTDIWRITATLGNYSESADITVNAIVPRTSLPDDITLAEDTFRAVAGEWIRMSLDVSAQPAGTKLPDTGADFWRLEMNDETAANVAEFRNTNTTMMIRFSEVGMYSGILKYESGNAKYQIPVYFYIVDDQGETTDPELKLTGSAIVNKVWMDGLTGIGIASLALADLDSAMISDAGAALVKASGAEWSVQITSGASHGKLAVAATEPGQALLMLTGMTSVGTIGYQVTCTAGGKAYQYTGQVEVVDQNTAKPTLNLSQNAYTLSVGETVIIDRRILDADTGARMASAESWENNAAIAAMGFEYLTGDDTWSATFFEEGDFHTAVEVTVGNLRYTLPLTFKVLKPGQTAVRYVLHMPGALTTLEEEAMAGVAANVVDLRGSNVTFIGSKAFGSNPKLELAYIPASVTSIAADAFSGSGFVVIACVKGSYAHTWANQHGYAVVFLQ